MKNAFVYENAHSQYTLQNLRSAGELPQWVTYRNTYAAAVISVASSRLSHLPGLQQSKSSEKAILPTVSRLRRLLRNADLATNPESVIGARSVYNGEMN